MRVSLDMKFLTDMHTHSAFSHDGKASLSEMLAAAYARGFAFYGVSEHFDFDIILSKFSPEAQKKLINAEPEIYFHEARHLREDYEGAMNVFIGAELGFSDDKEVQKKYCEFVEKYKPEFIINSVHSVEGVDYVQYAFTKGKTETYREYLSLVRRSLDAPYPYDIVGHLGYVARYVPFEDKDFDFAEFGGQIDDILKTIIAKDKTLEVNSANKKLATRTLPCEKIVRRYRELGGKSVSFGSDAHDIARIGDKRDEVIEMLKRIGFRSVTVPYRGAVMEHIEVEI